MNTCLSSYVKMILCFSFILSFIERVGFNKSKGSIKCPYFGTFQSNLELINSG